MIKRFSNYSLTEFLDADLQVGLNPLVSDDVIFYNSHNIILGNNVRIDSQCIFVAGKNNKIIIGDNCHINSGCVFHGNSGNIVLHNKVELADKVVLYTSTYDYSSLKENNEKILINGDIKMEADVIIGCGSVILPNVTIGTGSTLGANSLLKKSIENYVVFAGTPANFIKKRTFL